MSKVVQKGKNKVRDDCDGLVKALQWLCQQLTQSRAKPNRRITTGCAGISLATSAATWEMHDHSRLDVSRHILTD
eukprot:scaffold482904_cov21-Prasinocladus_malaysianus.AAC.1